MYQIQIVPKHGERERRIFTLQIEKLVSCTCNAWVILCSLACCIVIRKMREREGEKEEREIYILNNPSKILINN